MAPRKMDHESAQRIAKSRGPNDGFAKRADQSARNHAEKADCGSGASTGKGAPGKKKDKSTKSK
ncbi:hypothetical protein F5Y18DRAFT_430565 [Xylariaceae sp. FL1019]|nr:hypothetical protein F5Y18DRAFT_430565 [Xylariaceae sp. FL1019]